MPTGFDYIGQDNALQQHWLKRFVAILLDAIIVYVPTVVFISVIGGRYVSAGLLSGVFLFLYSGLFDFAIGGTIGKRLMRMKAVSMKGSLTLSQALMRNASKIFAPLLLIDWVIGMAVDTHDPRQKWTDQLAHTSVIVHDHPGGV
jgi:uncharacterized RDD family membrane protein YckC